MKHYVPPRYNADYVAPFDKPLSPREIDVLQLIIQGYTNDQIGDCHGTTRQTVKNQVTAILRKLGVQNRTQAAVKWLQP